MICFCVVTLIILIGSMSYEEEDPCHMRRRIHVIRIIIRIVSASSSSSSSLSLSLSLSR
jgi:hypothetical protein